ncbi:PTPLA-domain-containing protein [Lepidopterella palustris CBS 459.81]|uniref:Very-long-chain (3R)-3-hydroxyacyl-CoA dehydratase n=1 Tax=Lepidopterella palustris CBS 459.81 TaxID=1314670 RepID=A0A8E2DZN4_9PEZI|nr:PTPLA-domain-containing protein [Lepidopterella palustris CBS 459.81]
MPTQNRQPVAASNSSLKTTYLLSYNFVSAILWLTILGRVVLLSVAGGAEEVYKSTEMFARLTQTVAVLEVMHSLFGIVRAPVTTTLMQVASRLLLVWGIGYNFPQTTATSPAYASMLVAWSFTEVVRYSYFVFVLGGAGVPGALGWLRYNTFYILYPLGVGSETWLIYKAIEPASEWNPLFGYALWAILAIYVPGFYVLFTHMLKQRRRIMRGKGKARD